MKWFGRILLLLALTVSLTGCVENAMLVKLKKDGSGTIVYRLFLSDSMTDMMQSMSAMGLEGGEAAAPAAPDLFGEIKQSLAGQFGGGATLQSSRELKNKAGWKGFEGVYAFDDITQVKLYDIDPMGDGGQGPGSGSVGGKYTIEFTPGETAQLKLIPDAAASAAPSGGEDIDMSGMPMEAMKPMLSGMRMSFLLAVDGEVVDTNASFQNKKHPNVITLMDLSMDKLMADPEGMKLLESGKSSNEEALAKLAIPGVMIEPPDKQIEISFK